MKRTIDDIHAHYGPLLAERALDTKAVLLSPQKPFCWASGYWMPIYNDNRRLLGDASTRALIAEAFSELLKALNCEPQGIVGTATAGIPHATTLADRLGLPLSYVRTASKDHGMGNRIEGLDTTGSYHGRLVVLIEDVLSTGKSALDALQAIRLADGNAPYCLAIFSYGFREVEEAFASLEPSCLAIAILTYGELVRVARKRDYICDDEKQMLEQWRSDPFGWGTAHGYPPIQNKE